MELILSENPRRGLPKDIVKRYGITKRAWAEARKRRSAGSRRHARPNPKPARKTSRKRRARHHAYSGTIARPVLHRSKPGVYARTSVSHARAPKVVVQNPRRRRHHSYRRNPNIMGSVMESGKVLLGFVGVNVATNLAMTGINMVKTLTPTQAPWVKNGVRIALGLFTPKLVGKYIGGRTAEQVSAFVVTYSLFQIVLQFAQSNTTLAPIATNYLSGDGGMGAIFIAPNTSATSMPLGRVYAKQLPSTRGGMGASQEITTAAAFAQGG